MNNSTISSAVSRRNNSFIKFISILVLILLVNGNNIFGASATNTWSTTTTGGTWVKTSNWQTISFNPGNGPNSNVAVWGTTTDVAQIGVCAFTGAVLGINFNAAAYNGTTTNSGTGTPFNLGAIVFQSSATKSITISNSANLTAGVMNLNGGYNLSNLIVDNQNTTYSLTLADGTSTMGIVLNNATNNIVKTLAGGINISSIISGSNPLEKQGTGTLTLSGVNTYSGNTTISAGTLALSTTGSISSSPIITIGSGGTFDVKGLTAALTLGASQSLKTSATGSNTTGTLTVASGKGLTLSAGGLAFTAYGGGATAPLTVTGVSAGALALNSAPITVTTTSALTAGTYTLVAKGGSATGVSGTPGTLTVNGSGTASNTSSSVSVVSGQLILTVVNTTSSASDIIANTSFTYPSNIAYSSYQGTTPLTTGNSIEVGQFDIRDGGATTDGDALGTTLTGLTLNVSNSGGLRRIALFDGTTNVGEVAAGATATFSGLTLAAADGSSKTFSVRVSFLTSVTDNQQFSFTVSSATASAAGSTFAAAAAGGAATSTAGDNNRIEVTATNLLFNVNPSSVNINTVMSPSPTVVAKDGNGNIDLDFTGSVTLSSTGTIAGGATNPVSAVSGTATFSNLLFSAPGTGITIAGAASGVTATGNSNTFNATSITPTLTADASANTVDNNIDITFPTDAIWEAAITAVKIGGTALRVTTDYVVSAGNIRLKPSGLNALLTTSGSKAVTIEATGYTVASITQVIGVGADAKLAMTNQPIAPGTNGSSFGSQPAVTIQDQYGNATASTASIVASVGAGTWTLGGTTTVAAVAGTTTFSGLTATSLGPVSGATISFSCGSLTGVSSNGFTIVAPIISGILVSESSPTVDAAFHFFCPDNATWSAAITSITVGGTALTSGYSISGRTITFTPSANTLLQSSGSKTIAIIATGYANSTVSMTLGAGAAAKLAMNIQPTAPATNGAALATQPSVYIQDQYGNTTTSTASVVASVGAGTWTLGGATSVAASAGITTFSGLTATSEAAVTGGTISFTCGVLTGVTSSGFNIPVPVITLTAASNPTVDAAFNVTFTDNPTWRAAITSITVGGTTLAGGYSVSAGSITFTPSGSTLLQTNGSKAIVVIATGYANATVTQAIGVGAATKLGMKTQPVASATNGAAFGTQPAIYIQDQYGNTTASTATVAAAVELGSWTLGGTLTKIASSGTSTFTGLTATSAAAVTGATITFSSAGLTSVSSSTFNIVAPIITLTAASSPTVDAAFNVTFTDNPTWRAAITSITVGGTVLAGGYSVSAGIITFTPSGSTLLQTNGSKAIVVIATGYANATVTQAIGVGAAAKLAIKTQPAAPSTNGAVLATQPAIYIQDQYGNTTTSAATVAAAIGAGTWTLGGTTSKAGVSGTATFTNLTATCAAAVTGATITFTSGVLTLVTSATFDLPIIVAQPSVPTSLSFGTITSNSFNASFVAPGTAPTGYIVLRNATTAVTGTPVAGTVYTLGQTNIGSGINEVMYVGTGVWATTAQAGLLDNTAYHYAIYSYNGTGITTSYSATALTGNQTTSSISAPTATTATGLLSDGFTANWGPVTGAASYKLDVSSTPFITPATDLFISEYVEGTSYNKYIEIYNGTGASVDLSNYELGIGTNGSGTPSYSPMTGTLANGSVVVYMNASATLTLPNGVSAINNGACTFNGNDAIVLHKKSPSSYVDIFGRLGNDPGTEWTSASNSTVDKTLVRKSTVSGGITTSPTGTGASAFTTLESEWTQYAVDVVSNLGSHTYNPAATPTYVSGYQDLTVNGTSKLVTGLSANTTYYYRVRAVGNNSTSGNSNTITALTSKITPTLSVSNSPQTYTGSTIAATVTGSVAGVVSNVKYDGSATVPTNAGTYAITANFVPTDGTNYSSLTDASAGSFVISKATPTLSISNTPQTYTGSAIAATVTGSVAGTVSNEKYNGSATVPTAAGTYALTANFVPTDATNYSSLTDASAGSFVISKATPTLSISNTPQTYTGSAIAATVTGSVAGTVSNEKYNGSATVPTAAGTYALTANFVPTDATNYSSLTDASAGNFVISKATPTLTVSNSPVTYDGTAKSATATALGGGVVSNITTGGAASQTNAGTYAVTADIAASTNYNAATGVTASNSFVIDKATQSITFGTLSSVDIASGTFDLTGTASSGLGISYASSNTAVATVTGSTVTLVGTGSTTITASQAGNTNYLAASNVGQSLTVTRTAISLSDGNTSYTAAAVTGSTADVTVSSNSVLTLGTGKTVNSLTTTTGGQVIVNSPLVVSTSLTVEPTAKLDLSSTVTVNGDLNLKADNSGSFNANLGNGGITVTGNVKYLRTIDDQKWYFISFPCDVNVSDIRLSNGTTLGVLGTDWFIMYYDGNKRATQGTGSNWIHLTSADYSTSALKLNAYQGYAFGLNTVGAPYSLELAFPIAKSLVTGDAAKSVPVSDNVGSIGTNHNGWNLVGQPYLSRFAGSKVGINFITKWTGTAYDPKLSSLATIDPFEAYFVQVGSGAHVTGIAFDLAGRQSVKTSVETNTADLLALSLATDGGVDNTTLILDDSQSTAYQIGQDLEKMISTGTAKPQVYTVLGNINFAFNALPAGSVQNLPLGIYTKTTGTATISADASQTKTLSALFLTDNSNGAVTDLLTTSYSFTATAGTNTSRFVLTARKISTGINNLFGSNSDAPLLSTLNGTLIVSNLNSSKPNSIRVYDALGKLIISKNVTSNSIEIKLNTDGIYTVQVLSGDKSYTTKSIIRK